MSGMVHHLIHYTSNACAFMPLALQPYVGQFGKLEIILAFKTELWNTLPNLFVVDRFRFVQQWKASAGGRGSHDHVTNEV